MGCRKDGITLEITTFRAEVYHPDSRKPVVAYSDDIATDLSRDHGWEPLKKAGWEGVSLVAVNEAWAAMRFKRE